MNRGFDYYSGYFYEDAVPEDCEQPVINQIMAMSEEELKDMPLEEQVRLLKEQVNELGNTLSRCIQILNQFQRTSSDYMRFMEHKSESVYYSLTNELERHTGQFHAMLIIGNKEAKKDESDIF